MNERARSTIARTSGFASEDAVVDDVVELSYGARERSRLRATMLSGREIGIDLPVGTILRHGSKLLLEGGGVVAVEACDEDLLEVRAPGAAELARIAYHIGNRHVPIQVGDGWIRILPDHVLQGDGRGPRRSRADGEQPLPAGERRLRPQPRPSPSRRRGPRRPHPHDA